MNIYFANELCRLRKQARLSQEKLAEYAGVSRQAVAKWENGENLPEIDKLINLADIFSVTIDNLLRSSNCTVTSSERKTCDNEATQLPVTVLIDFICNAKKYCYAGENGAVSSCRPQSHDLAYSEQIDGYELRYLDTYVGSRLFTGEEVVWYKDEAVWAMNYSGKVLSSEFTGDVLKSALLQVPKEIPYRGPEVYSKGDYIYNNQVQGDLSWFNGYEAIYCKGRKVYECLYHGGKVLE